MRRKTRKPRPAPPAWSLTTAPLFLFCAHAGLSTDAAGGAVNPTYSMLLSASDAPLISLPARQAVNVVIQPGYALVQWNPVTWSVSGKPKQPSNVLYTIYIWPSDNPSPAFNLAAPCGIDAFNTASPGVVYSVTDGVQKNISALDPTVTYTIAVKATCSAEMCMFANLPSMSIAYIPATVQRLVTSTPTRAPAPSLSRSSSPSYSASASPSPPQAPPTQASIGPAAATAIAAFALGVFLTAGVAFVCWRRRRANWRSVGTKLQARNRADAQYRQLGDGKQ